MKNSILLAPMGRGGGGGIISESRSSTRRPAKRFKIRAIRLPNGILKTLNSGLSVSGSIAGFIFRTRNGKSHLYAIKSSAIRNSSAKAVITVALFSLSALIATTSSIRIIQRWRFINQDHTKMAVHQSGSHKASGSSIRIIQRWWFINQDHTKMAVHQSGSHKASGSSIRIIQRWWFINQDHERQTIKTRPALAYARAGSRSSCNHADQQ